MKTEEIISAGIDIGTSTTQLIFSRIVLQNVGGFGKIPQIKVISKEIIYESDVFFTPLSSCEEIDGEAVKQLLMCEYEKAGLRPDDLTTGAVIITGESSRKKNAKEVVRNISSIAGDFVVATAGADLESVLAGKGSGAAELSKQLDARVVNLDIGGGTTNICLFENGEVMDTACLDIGGRLLKMKDGIITYVAPKIIWLAEQMKLTGIWEGSNVDTGELVRLTDAMAEILAESIGLSPNSQYIDHMKTNHLLGENKEADIVTFSGGVASCMTDDGDAFRYGDIGVLLARSIKRHPAFGKITIGQSKETVRATVIGAGNYSMNISGSTIEYTSKEMFPLKNIPVVKVPLEKPEDIEMLDEYIHKTVKLYIRQEDETSQYAIAMKGLKCPSFKQIQNMAMKLTTQFLKESNPKDHFIIILEEDMGKALGQAIHRIIGNERNLICIDGINCECGDYIDLGEPVASGSVIPVVVKTLIFNK